MMGTEFNQNTWNSYNRRLRLVLNEFLETEKGRSLFHRLKEYCQ